MLSRVRNHGVLNMVRPSLNIRRGIITGPSKTTGVPKSSKSSTASKNSNAKDKSGSPFDSSFTFQLFLIVGAMGAGYTLGKTTIMNTPPATLFPQGSTTSYELLKEYESIDKERENKQYDMFKRCILRILQGKDIEVDMKYGENESLYENAYCNKEISTIMNDADGIGDVFFGKDPKHWENKSFIFYPENTDDVSSILKCCNEFKIPVYTPNCKIEPKGLVFQIDFKNFTNIELLGNDKLKINAYMNLNRVNEELKIQGLGDELFINNELNAVDLFLMSCGIQLTNTRNKLINNLYSIGDIKGFECVLPDGEILSVEKNTDDKFQDKIFSLISKCQEDIAVITKVFIDRDQIEDSQNKYENKNLIVVGSNDLQVLNNAIKELTQKSDNKIDLVDNNGSEYITNQYGRYKTFLLTVLSDKDIQKLNRKYNEGMQNEEMAIIKKPVAELGIAETRRANSYFSQCAEEGASAIIVNSNVGNPTETTSNTYYAVDPVEENLHCVQKENRDDPSHSVEDFYRRLKLSVDSNRILNRDSGVLVVSHPEPADK